MHLRHRLIQTIHQLIKLCHHAPICLHLFTIDLTSLVDQPRELINRLLQINALLIINNLALGLTNQPNGLIVGSGGLLDSIGQRLFRTVELKGTHRSLDRVAMFIKEPGAFAGYLSGFLSFSFACR
ncbi:hypothetical protein R3J22_07710 [Trueperella bernardiae]|uniref:hypothetical protein n=1 Tax=Trueperella bernardiae TaxID=59561 RepID=UPI00294A6B4F|nr:hypothetical protein [Trueperella bernardiae]MDV6239411.1 hypothetical protein [Trueperella bernardiae]